MAMTSTEAIRKQRDQVDARRERLMQELNRIREQEQRISRRAAKAVQERVKKLGVNADDLALISGAVALILQEGREDEARAAAAEAFGEDIPVTVDDTEDADEDVTATVDVDEGAVAYGV